jgi:hypothetical protein
MAPSTPTGLLVFAVLVGQAAGFASSLGGYHAADPVGGECTDTSNVVMSGITGGKTCADLAAEGRCASTDDLVKTVMEKNCMASCGGCGEGRASRAYVQYGGAVGDWVMKVYDEAAFFGLTALPESEVASKVCGAQTRWSNGKCELEAHFQAYEGSSRFDPAQLVCQTRDCAFAYLRSVAFTGNDWTICRNGQVQPAAYVNCREDCQLKDC